MEGPHAASLVQEGVTHTGRRSRTVGSAECHRGSTGIGRGFLCPVYTKLPALNSTLTCTALACLCRVEYG